MQVTFTALVKQTTAKALVSGDKSFRVLLETGDQMALKSGEFLADKEVTVTITCAE